MKILAPVDGSKYSAAAIRQALDFVKMKGAELYIVSVVLDIAGLDDHEISPSRVERHMAILTRQGERVVAQAANLAKELGGEAAYAKTIAAPISVPDAIVELAEEEKIDLIIIGSRGLSRSTRFKLGSVATQVVKASPCSVFLVKLPPE